MPSIPINLGDVEAFDNLPEGSYLGQIDKTEWRAAREAGKFPQIMVTYTVIDGEHIGRKSSEFLSLSPKAAFRLKRWFSHFGLDNQENLDVDDETDQLIDPDLVGVQVVFQVRADGFKLGTTDVRYRTELVSVEDDMTQQNTAAIKQPTEVEALEMDKEDRPVRPARPAPTVAPAQPRRTLR